jgi:RNA polymerase subunit RPABC4/transcription elongation factor Spt4
MKQLLVIASAILLTVSACKKDDKTKPTETATTPVVENTEFSFNVNGTKIIIDSTVAIVDTTTTPYDRVSVEAYSNGKLALQLVAWARVSADTVGGGDVYLYYNMPIPDTDDAYDIVYDYEATSGHFNITTLDLANNKIVGTFNFEASYDGSSYSWSGNGQAPVLPDHDATKTITEGHLYITNVQIGTLNL